MCIKFPFVFYSKAKLMLRKKKFQESLIEKTDGQLENIERMVCLLPLKNDLYRGNFQHFIDEWLLLTRFS